MNAKNIISIVVFILLIGGIVPFMFGGLSGISGDYEGAVYGEELGTRNDGIKELEHENVDGDTFKLKYIYKGTTYETTITYEELELYNRLNEGNVLYLDGTYDSVNGWFVDKSGNGNHGTPYNGATTGTGVVGDGMSFDSSNLQYLNCGNSLDFDLTNNFSISCWVKVTDLSKGNNNFIVNKGSSYKLEILDTTGMIRFTSWGVKDYAYAGALVAENTYTHITTVFDSSNDVSFYVSGVFIGKTEHNVPANSNPTNNLTVSINQLYGMMGNLDEIRIYNRALTEDEITALYNHNAIDKFLSIPENAQIYANYKYGGHSNIINNDLIVMGLPLIMMVIFVSIIITKMR